MDDEPSRRAGHPATPVTSAAVSRVESSLRVARALRIDSASAVACTLLSDPAKRSVPMRNVIYIVGLVVVVIAVLSFFGLR